MWELLQQRLMRSRSSWRGELYSGVKTGIWICTSFPFVKVIVCGMCVFACIVGIRVVTVYHSGC